MSSSSLPPDSGDELPIDAEFEPAEPKQSPRSFGTSGPGWPAFGLVTLIAVSSLFFALASVGYVPGFHPGSGKVNTLESELAALKASQTTGASQATDLNAEIVALKGRADSLRADRTRTVTDLRAIRDELNTMQEDVSALQRARVATLAEADDSDSDGASALGLSALDTRVTALEDALVSQLDGYTLAIDLLKSRLDALEDRAGSETLTAATATNNRTEAALALSAIEAAARRGRPFLSAYQRLNTAMPGNAAVQTLSPLASKAVPTQSDLIADFPALKNRALDEEAQTAPGATGWMRGLFGDGIQVRRKDAVTTSDHLAHANDALQAGELAESIEHIRAIDSNLQPVFTDWLQNAEDRHQLEETLEALRLAMIAEERP